MGLGPPDAADAGDQGAPREAPAGGRVAPDPAPADNHLTAASPSARVPA